eukprot:gene1149-1254_t
MASISLPQTKLKSVAITGASGLMGSHLARGLEAQGVRVIRISRQPPAATDEDSSIQWDVSSGKLSRVDLLEGLDAFIHLAGDNVASGEGPLAFLGQWSEEKKRSIMDSRVLSSRLVVKTLASLRKKPAVLVSASAVGYYGYTDFAAAFDESCPQRGSGFLAEVVENWEREALRAQQEAGVRTVCLRLAPILSTEAGMLAKLLPVFSWGLGGPVGSGQQPLPWVTLQDSLRAVLFAAESRQLSGPVNVCSPQAVTNAEFSAALGKALWRPWFFPLPEFVAQNVFGQMGREMLLGGQRVVPKKILEAGFVFEDADLDQALKKILSQSL